MRARIEAALQAVLPAPLVRRLLDAHVDLKQNFHMSRYRPSELEAGRFSEAAIRAAQHLATGKHVLLTKPLPRFDKLITDLANVPSASAHESVRLHIPRALWSVYGVRNRRDVGHIGGDVNPNRADAHFVVAVCDWVLAELVRLTYGCSLAEAQALVDDLVERETPIIQEFDGFLKVLRPDLSTPDKIMAILYRKGTEGATCQEIKLWLKGTKGGTIDVALSRLEHDKAHIHRADGLCRITKAGAKYVEETI